MRWTWRWIPDPPAQFGDNVVFDWVRLVVVLVGVILIFAIGRVVREQARREVPMPRGQRLRFLALAAADAYISLTEMAVFGTPASPRLAVGLVVVTAGLFGVCSMRRKQHAQPVVR